MIYNPPSGSTDPDASYIGKNVGAGIQGSRVPRSAVEHPLRELVALIREGLPEGPSAADLRQVLKAIRGGRLTTFVATGSANTLAIAAATPHTTLFRGLPFRIFPSATNTQSAVTLTVNGTLEGAVVRTDGTALAVGDIVAGCPFDVVHDGSRFRLMGPGRSEIAPPSPGSIIYRGANTGGVNAIIADIDPSPAQYEIRGLYVISLGGPNTGAVTANLDGLGEKQVLRSNGTQLRPGDIRRVAVLSYDGTAFVLLNLAQEIAPPGSGFTGEQTRFGFTGQAATPSVLTATFTVAYAGVVLAFSTLNSSPSNGNSANKISVSVNGVVKNGAADEVPGASTSTTNAKVAAGDTVTVTSTVTPVQNSTFGMSQYLTYVFVPG